MKTLTLFAIMLVVTITGIAQTSTDPFTKIHADGNMTITLVHSESPSITINGGSNVPEGFTWEVRNGIMTLNGSKIKDHTDVRITSSGLDEIKLVSVANLNTEGTFPAENLVLYAEGASEYQMNLDCKQLTLDFKGASEAQLSGKADELTAKLSGAAEVNALGLESRSANITSDGASDIKVNVSETLKAQGKGAAEIRYSGNPTTVEVDMEGVASVKRSDDSGSSEDFDFNTGHINIDIEESDEYDGHWAGLDLMFCNFLSSYGDLGSSPAYPFMEPDFAKSFGVQINFMEFNFGMIEKPKFAMGLTTGLGLTVLNYRLDDNVRLINDSAVLMAYYDNTVSTIKSKLTATYLTLPVLFEFNTHGENNHDGFHFGIGGFGGVRIGSQTKVVVNDRGDKDRFKSNGSYHLNPFRYGAMVRLGWNRINLFANYAVSEMFESGEGPEVHPVEFGLSLDLN